MLMTLTASVPKVTNTTEMTPWIVSDGAPTFVVRRQNQRVVEESFIEIGEIQPCFKVGLAFRFIPYDPHRFIM